MQINYTASKTGSMFHMSDAKVRILMGPVGGGKTVTCCNEIFKRSLEQPIQQDGWRRSRWAISRNTYPELKSTTMKTWLEWFPEEHFGRVKWDTPIVQSIKMANIKVELQIFFISLDKEKDVKKLLSLELTGIWFNEAREVPWSLIERARERCGRYPSKSNGGSSWSGVIMDTNPPDTSHWIYTKFVEEAEKNPLFKLFRQPPAILKQEDGSYILNPEAENVQNIDEGAAYYLDKVQGKSEEDIKVYLMGDFGFTADGKPVYGEFNDNLHVSHNNLLTPDPKEPLAIGFDFGNTPCCVIGQWDEGVFEVYDELVTEDSNIEEFTKSILTPFIAKNYPEFSYVVSGDPSGQARTQTDGKYCFKILRENGYDIKAAPSNNNQPRLGAVKRLLSTLVRGKPAFRINARCKVLIKGFHGNYKFQRLQVVGSDLFKEKPLKNEFSHIHDALQYIVLYLTNKYSRKPISIKPERERRGWMTR